MAYTKAIELEVDDIEYLQSLVRTRTNLPILNLHIFQKLQVHLPPPTQRADTLLLQNRLHQHQRSR